MNALTWFAEPIFGYGIPAWLGFIAVAFFLARYVGWLGVPLSFFVVAIGIYMLDVRWVMTAMRAPGWDGSPDMDMGFMFGVLIRVVIVNAILLPVAACGLWFKHRYHRQRAYFRPKRRA
jgi:uncharacterized membrane protein